MGFSSWLRRLTSNRAARRRTPHRPASVRFRPRLEALEDRWLPSQIGLTVTSLLDDGSAGTLRAAIQTADAGSPSDKFTISFASGLTGTIDLQSALPALNNNITIQGPGADSLTVEPEAGVSLGSAIFVVDPGQSVSLSGLKIANGNDGGIANDGGTLTVSACTISGNSADSGGGIVNSGVFIGGSFVNGTLTVSACTISGNSADSGGGIVNGAGDTLTVSGSTLSGNSATYGGGIDNIGTMTVQDSSFSDNSAVYGGGLFNYHSLTVSGCTFTDNTATDSGGGLFTDGFTQTVRDSSFSGNSADFGGGIYNADRPLTVSGTSFTANTASEGGAIYNNAYGTLDVHGGSFSDNTASDSGGGLYNLGTATIQESHLFGNTAANYGGGIYNGASGTLTIDDSDVSANTAPLGADLYNLGDATLNDSTVGVISSS